MSTVLRFCSRCDISVTARSGGHDFFGRSLTDGIVLDMRSMDSVIVSPDRNTARIGGGAIGVDVQEKLDKQGVFTPTGQAKSVGYVSWACGGGYGFYAGPYGLGVDQIVGSRVVLSNGEVVDTDDDPELLWALRGAGAGTFGVVAELRVKVYPIPKIYAGFLAFPLSDAEAVLDGYDKLRSEEGIPDDCSGDCLVANPPMLGVDASGPCYSFYFCYAARDGDLSPGKKYIDKLAKLGNVVGNTVEESEFLALCLISQIVIATFTPVANLDSETGSIWGWRLLVTHLLPQPQRPGAQQDHRGDISEEPPDTAILHRRYPSYSRQSRRRELLRFHRRYLP